VDSAIPPKDFWSDKSYSYRQLTDFYNANGYIGHISFFAETDKHLLLHFNALSTADASKKGFAFIDKQTGSYKVFNSISLGGYVWTPRSYQILYNIKDGSLGFLIDAADIVNNSIMRSRLPGVRKGDNPVLVIAKIK
jgi:hypothetical protein